MGPKGLAFVFYVHVLLYVKKANQVKSIVYGSRGRLKSPNQTGPNRTKLVCALSLPSRIKLIECIVWRRRQASNLDLRKPCLFLSEFLVRSLNQLEMKQIELISSVRIHKC